MNKSEIAARDNAAYIVESLALETKEETGRTPSREQLLEASAFIEGVMYRDYIGGRKTDAQTFRKIVQKAKTRLTGEYQPARFSESGERIKDNPKGVYLTYKSWLAAAKKAGAVRLDGDKDIAMAFDANGRGVAEWDGAEGYIYKTKSMIDDKMVFENPVRPRKGESSRDFVSRCMSEEHSSFPEPKQRIAVCLSKSRRRRNPLESGATISDDEDINRQAAKMG